MTRIVLLSFILACLAAPVAARTVSATTGAVNGTAINNPQLGGDRYHGAVYADYENKAFGPRNIDDAQIAKGLTGSPAFDVRATNRVSMFRDFNVDSGGSIRKEGPSRAWSTSSRPTMTTPANRST